MYFRRNLVQSSLCEPYYLKVASCSHSPERLRGYAGVGSAPSECKEAAAILNRGEFDLVVARGEFGEISRISHTDNCFTWWLYME